MCRLQTAVIGVAMALVGCGEHAAISALRIELVGSASVQDRDPSQPGAQTELRFAVLDGFGLPLRVTSATLDVPSGKAVARPGQIFFPRVTLQPGDNTVRLAAIDQRSGAPLSTTVMLRAPLEPVTVIAAAPAVAVTVAAPSELQKSRTTVAGSSPATETRLFASTGPAINSVKPDGTAFFFVAQTNSHLLTAPATGYVADKVPGGDAQVDVSFIATGAAGGTASISYGGVLLAPLLVLTADPQVVRFDDMVLPHDSTGAVELRVVDGDGMIASWSAATTVDVIAPAAPTLSAALAADGARTGTVELSWTGGGDDGATGSAVGFDLRWTNEVVAPGGITDETTFQDATKTRRVSGALLTGTSYTLTGLPPLTRTFLQARAVDEVGNLSPLGTQREVDNAWTQKQLTSGTANYTGFGFELQAADLNADGKSDLIVPSMFSDEVRLFYGQATLGTWTAQVVSGPAGAVGFGASVSAGDVSGDGTNDLVVGADWAGNQRGHAFVYFGTTGAMGASYVELRGTSGATGYFGGGVKAIGDLNGDGIGEVAISANGESKTYVFFGRSQAAWLAARTANDSGAAYVPASAADRVFVRSGGNSLWGFQRGCVNVPDLDGDGRAELVLPNGGSVGLFTSSALAQAELPISMSSALQTLSGVAGFFGFGSEVRALDVIGGAAIDLVVGASSENALLIYPDGSAAGFTEAPTRVTGAAGFGNAVNAGDLNGDGHTDLIVGTTWIGESSTWVLYNNGAGYDSNAGNGFSQSKLLGGDGLGISTAVGDFNGDGKPDLASGDDVTGQVSVWY